MIQTTATDFKANLGKYLSLVRREDIHITKNGKYIAVLTAPRTQSDWVDGLIGIIPADNIDEKQIKAGRLVERYESLY